MDDRETENVIETMTATPKTDNLFPKPRFDFNLNWLWTISKSIHIDISSKVAALEPLQPPSEKSKES